jgi:hypothetical protein
MKTGKILSFILATVLVLSANSLFAQFRKIPAEVTDAFYAKYPVAKKVEWKDKLSSFVATFELEGESHEARFTNKGIWEQTETKLEESKIPTSVNDGFSKSKYADWEVKYASEIKLPGDTVNYKMIVAKSKAEKMNLTFNSNGKLLRDSRTL